MSSLATGTNVKSPIPRELTVVSASEISLLATTVAALSLTMNFNSGAIGVAVASV